MLVMFFGDFIGLVVGILMDLMVFVECLMQASNIWEEEYCWSVRYVL